MFQAHNPIVIVRVYDALNDRWIQSDAELDIANGGAPFDFAGLAEVIETFLLGALPDSSTVARQKILDAATNL